LKNFVKCRKNRNGDGNTSLFSANRRDAIADMLTPEAHRIAAAQAAVGQDTKPNALCGPYRPTRFVPLDIVFGPCREATIFRARRIFHAGSGIRSDVAGCCETSTLQGR